jgi:2,4-dienoyl-CoA reductase-like NADH-dependent reductase (Old Yellow Enzyme family)
MEATAVVPEGRISPEDAGLWADSQIEPLKRAVDFAHAHAAKVGIQLAHAGRKASTLAPWVQHSADRTRRLDRSIAFDNENGWPDNGTSPFFFFFFFRYPTLFAETFVRSRVVYGPSNVPWAKGYPTPKEMTEDDLQYVEDAFVAATKRSASAGCQHPYHVL